LVKPVGSVIWLGPLFIPNQTGCWECLAHRLRGNREVETAVQHQQKISTPFPTSRAILPSSLAIGINWAAMEIAKAIARGTHPQLEGKILTFDLVKLSLQEHTLVKRPQCPICAVSVDLGSQKPKPIVLNSHKKQFSADGGHRSLSPEQTLKKYEYHISPITGVVSALPKVDGTNDLIQVYTAIHKNGEGKLDNLTELRLNLRHKSAGKGKTDQQSKASGFCEAIERYSGIFTGDEIRIQGIYTELGSVAIHPNDCMQYSATQYQNRETLNSQQHTNFAWIPEPFDLEREIEWTPVWSLTNQTFKYVPTAYCYYDYPLADDHCFCKGDSNGNAAGNTLEEAILQGFMELVERDSVAVWWYNRVQRPGVDLDSFDEPYFQALRDYYQTQNYQLWVIDITNDLGIPSFAALARRTNKTLDQTSDKTSNKTSNKTSEEILMGFGTHFDPKIAILRAVTELNQMYVVVLNEANDVPFDDPDMEYWMKNVTVENQPYLAPDQNAAAKVYGDYPNLWSDDLRQDVLTCVDIVAKHGMETLILDQTRPDIGLNVVKVIVPGMRHFWPRFAPGRLYDVPVKLGWLPAPLKEEELNPIPMFC
jgi:oxazoline/thiazoline synthase